LIKNSARQIPIYISSRNCERADHDVVQISNLIHIISRDGALMSVMSSSICALVVAGTYVLLLGIASVYLQLIEHIVLWMTRILPIGLRAV
jgi:hypothetical protein